MTKPESKPKDYIQFVRSDRKTVHVLDFWEYDLETLEAIKDRISDYLEYWQPRKKRRKKS